MRRVGEREKWEGKRDMGSGGRRNGGWERNESIVGKRENGTDKDMGRVEGERSGAR